MALLEDTTTTASTVLPSIPLIAETQYHHDRDVAVSSNNGSSSSSSSSCMSNGNYLSNRLNRTVSNDHNDGSNNNNNQQKKMRRLKTTGTSMSEMEMLVDPISTVTTSGTAQTTSSSHHKGLDGTNIPTSSSSPQVVVMGYDISHLSSSHQFAICAGGTFGFTLIYGFLQELVIVNIAGRKFAVFLAACQFLFFSLWSLLLVSLRQISDSNHQKKESSSFHKSNNPNPRHPMLTYQFVGLSIIRAVDVTVSNLSMKYLNYPARTLIKSSRVVFTMMLGVVIQNKRYQFRDYFAVALLVLGLCIFLHADSTSSAVFHPFGVFLLILSLTCDGVINNLSEKVMMQYNLSQDDYHLRLYSLSFIASAIGAYMENEIWLGCHHFFLVPGTVPEIESGVFDHNPTTWTVSNKIMVFFLLYMTGLFGGSCLGAITRRFGALTMTLTSTTRKAATMFVSFSLFAHNTCTWEHVLGITLYIVSLLIKGYSKARKHSEEKLKSPMMMTINRSSLSLVDDVEKAASSGGSGGVVGSR